MKIHIAISLNLVPHEGTTYHSCHILQLEGVPDRFGINTGNDSIVTL